jgi:hypothetical protein
MKHTKTLLAAAATILIAGTTSLALAANEPHKRLHPMMSLDAMATQNVLLNTLSQRTGKTPSELQAMFESEDPRTALEAVGLDRATMRTETQKARKTVIQQALQYGMITADQAEDLEATPGPGMRPMRMMRRNDDAEGTGN